MKIVKKLIILLLAIIICYSYRSCPPNLKIIKVETEYKSGCFEKDSCTISKKIYYKDGEILSTFYYKYPSFKSTFLDSANVSLYEIKVLNSDSNKNQSFYNDKGDIIRYERKMLSSKVPPLIYNYKNIYDSRGRLHNRIEYDHKENITGYNNFCYDTLGYTKVEYVRDSINGDIVKIKYYNDKHMVKLYIAREGELGDHELSYDKQGNLIYEDIDIFVRKFYTYENNLLKETVEKLKGKTDMQTQSITKYKYEFDKQNRPIKTIKSTYSSNGGLTDETIIKTEYRN